MYSRKRRRTLPCRRSKADGPRLSTEANCLTRKPTFDLENIDPAEKTRSKWDCPSPPKGKTVGALFGTLVLVRLVAEGLRLRTPLRCAVRNWARSACDGISLMESRTHPGKCLRSAALTEET